MSNKSPSVVNVSVDLKRDFVLYLTVHRREDDTCVVVRNHVGIAILWLVHLQI